MDADHGNGAGMLTMVMCQGSACEARHSLAVRSADELCSAWQQGEQGGGNAV